MSLAKMLIKSPKKLKSFLNNISIPIHAWQIRQNNLFLIDYNSAAYEETKGEIKNNLGSIASEFYKENIDLIDVLKECADKSTSISKEIKYFCSLSNELKILLIKTDFIPPDLVLVQKISKIKQNLLEQKVTEAEEKYRLITEKANDMISILNHKYKYEYINEKPHLNILGYNSNDLIGKAAWRLIHPDDMNNFINVLKDKERYDEINLDFRVRHKNGDWIWIQSRGNMFTTENNKEKILLVSRDITLRKKAELKLRESEEKYRMISENANDILLLTNEKYEIEYVNNLALKNLLGYSEEEVIGCFGLDFIHPNDVEKTIHSLKKGIEEGQGLIEVRARHKKGHYIWIEATGKTFKDDMGVIKGTILLRDIAKRKSIKKKLMESEEKYRLLFEKSPYMIILVNEKGLIVDFNQNTLKYLKSISKNDLIGSSFLDLNFIPLRNMNKLKEIYKDLLVKGFSDPLEFYMDPGKNILIGTNLEWIEILTAMLKVGDDNIIQVIIKDISERKKVEEKIRESEEMFRKFFEESKDGVILTDENGVISKWNEGQERISGVHKTDIIGRPVWDAFFMQIPEEQKTAERYEFLKSSIENFFKTEKAPWLNKLQEIEVQNADGLYQCIQELPFSIRTKKGFMLGSINRDITESKKIEKKLMESEEKYRVAYDQADFYKNLFAHDISNILSVISGSSQLCSLFLENPEKAKEVKVNLNRIRDQVIRAKLLIKNVLRMSEINSNKPLLKSIDICKSLTKSIKYINESYEEKSVEIGIDSGNKQFFVYANDLIIDVFENLLINAINHNKNSIKKITISLAKEEKDGVQFLKIEFIDNGIGIADERKEIIFQKGYKKGKYTKGMGIGLTLVKNIIDSYNGFIWVEDRVPEDYSKGSNFIILVPLAFSEN